MNNHNLVLRYPNQSDLALCLYLPDFNGTPLSPDTFAWELELQTRGPKVKLVHESGVATVSSTGDIACTCTMEEGKIHIYAKSSTKPFGEGKLLCRLKMFLSSDRFPGGTQTVRMIEATPGQSVGPYEIETNITII